MKKIIQLNEDEYQGLLDGQKELKELKEQTVLAPHQVILNQSLDGVIQVMQLRCGKHKNLSMRRIPSGSGEMLFYCDQCHPELQAQERWTRVPKTVNEMSGAPDKLPAIEQDGKEARYRGSARKDNPYDVDFEPKAWRAWDTGWLSLDWGEKGKSGATIRKEIEEKLMADFPERLSARGSHYRNRHEVEYTFRDEPVPFYEREPEPKKEPLNIHVSLPNKCKRHDRWESGVMRDGNFKYLCVDCEAEETAEKAKRRDRTGTGERCNYWFIPSGGYYDSIQCSEKLHHVGIHSGNGDFHSGSWKPKMEDNNA